MASETGRKTAAVEQLLGDDPTRFSFFQLLRLLERDLGDDLDERLRVRPALGLEHQGSEVTDAEPRGDGGLDLVTSLAGLYGVNSPLPVFYTEDLIDAEQEDRPAARELLDIFHRRLYLLLYRAMQKYRPLFATVEHGDRRFRQLLDSFLGIRDAAIREHVHDPDQLVRYVGLFAQQPRSAMGLKTLLEDALEDIQVEVVQCEPRSVTVPDTQRCHLGRQGVSLGVDTTIGERVEDPTGRLVVRVGPLSAERFQALTRGPDWKTLAFLVRQYVDVPLEIEIEWLLDEGSAVPVQPGSGQWSRLGRDTWMGSDADQPVSGRLRLQ